GLYPRNGDRGGDSEGDRGGEQPSLCLNLKEESPGKTPAPPPFETAKTASTTSGKSKTPPKYTEADSATAAWMRDRINEVVPGPDPNLGKWADTIRLMRERDHLADSDIRSVFEWANNHSFWQAN